MPQCRMRPLVLNVDDDAANRYVKTRSLMMGEMEVIEAATGTTANVNRGTGVFAVALPAAAKVYDASANWPAVQAGMQLCNATYS